jgi:hypothetical protein
VVYSAIGSHASYARPGTCANTLRPEGRKIITVDDVAFACPDCPIWRTWLQMIDATQQPWYGFGGAWGQAANDGGRTGPLGPSEYKIAGQGRSPERIIDTIRKPVSQTGEAEAD